MRSRELVRRTLEFDSPPAVPRQVWILPWAEERYPETVATLRAEYPDDVVSAPAVYRSLVPFRAWQELGGAPESRPGS
jgi:hypothetical protein